MNQQNKMEKDKALLSNYEKKTKKILDKMGRKKLSYDELKEFIKTIPEGRSKQQLMDQLKSMKGTDKKIGKGELKSKIKSKLKMQTKDLGNKGYNKFTISGKADLVTLDTTKKDIMKLAAKEGLSDDAQEIIKDYFSTKSHFGQELGWIRVNKEEKYNGEPMWFVEEIQSDLENRFINMSREDKKILGEFKKILGDWNVLLLKKIVQMAAQDGAVYVGITMDTPAGLSKKAPKYKQLYIDTPEKLGFEKVDNQYLGREVEFNPEDNIREEEWREDEDLGFDSYFGYFIVNMFLPRLEGYGVLDTGEYEDHPFFEEYKNGDFYGYKDMVDELKGKKFKLQPRSEYDRDDELEELRKKVSEEIKNKYSPEEWKEMKDGRIAQGYRWLENEPMEEFINDNAWQMSKDEFKNHPEYKKIMKKYERQFYDLAKEIYENSYAYDEHYSEWYDRQIDYWNESDEATSKAEEPKMWVKKIGIDLMKKLTKMHESIELKTKIMDLVKKKTEIKP